MVEIEVGASSAKDVRLFDTIERSEQQIKAGKFVKADTSMNAVEIDNLLMRR